MGFKRQPREILKFVNSSIHLQNLRSLLLMYRDVRKARLDIEHTRALSSRPCIAPTFSSLAAPSALLVGGFCAWEEEGAPSSAALTRRAAPPMYAMGGAASFQPRPLPRSHRSRARTRLGGRTLTFTAARVAMSRHLHRSRVRNDGTNTRASHDRDSPTSPVDQDNNHASNAPPLQTSHGASESAISQADGEP